MASGRSLLSISSRSVSAASISFSRDIFMSSGDLNFSAIMSRAHRDETRRKIEKPDHFASTIILIPKDTLRLSITFVAEKVIHKVKNI